MIAKLILGWCLLMVLFGCTDNVPHEPELSDTVLVVPDQELYQASVRYDKSGLPRFSIEAKTISRFDSEMKIVMDGGIKVDFFGNFGEHTATLTARTGEVLERIKKLVAQNNVVVKSDSGMTLRTEHLYFDEYRNRVLSDSFVTIITPHDSLSGYGLDASPDLKDWVIHKPSGTTWRQTQKRIKND